jgi:hypothetical protein
MHVQLGKLVFLKELKAHCVQLDAELEQVSHFFKQLLQAS